MTHLSCALCLSCSRPAQCGRETTAQCVSAIHGCKTDCALLAAGLAAVLSTDSLPSAPGPQKPRNLSALLTDSTPPVLSGGSLQVLEAAGGVALAAAVQGAPRAVLLAVVVCSTERCVHTLSRWPRRQQLLTCGHVALVPFQLVLADLHDAERL